MDKEDNRFELVILLLINLGLFTMVGFAICASGSLWALLGLMFCQSYTDPRFKPTNPEK